jgi:hypothetical protein
MTSDAYVSCLRDILQFVSESPGDYLDDAIREWKERLHFTPFHCLYYITRILGRKNHWLRSDSLRCLNHLNDEENLDVYLRCLQEEDMIDIINPSSYFVSRTINYSFSDLWSAMSDCFFVDEWKFLQKTLKISDSLSKRYNTT